MTPEQQQQIGNARRKIEAMQHQHISDPDIWEVMLASGYALGAVQEAFDAINSPDDE
jgi:hypothetical protein